MLVLLGGGFLASAGQAVHQPAEAKRPAASVVQVSDAPPRTIDDILAALYEQPRVEPRPVDPREASESPPATTDRHTLVQFYFRRARAALEGGRVGQGVDDMEKAAEYADQGSSPPLFEIWNELANLERKLGDFGRHTDYLLKALGAVPKTDREWLITLNAKLVMVHAATGHLGAAEAALAEASKVFLELSSLGLPKRPEFRASARANLVVAQAALAEATGKYVLAEHGYREAITIAIQEAPGYYTRHPVLEEFEYFLVRTLIRQGRLLEAESEARTALLGALSKRGRLSLHTAWVLRGLVWVLLEQGRYREAERLAHEALIIFPRIGTAPDSPFLAVARAQRAIALAFQNRDREALAEYTTIPGAPGTDLVLFEHLLGDIGDYADVLLRTGHVDRVLETLHASLARRQGPVDMADRRDAELRGHLARAHAAKGDLPGALREFREAAPQLLRDAPDDDADTTTPRAAARRRGAILSSYIGLLADIAGTPLERAARIDAVAEAFRLADVVRWQSVQRALNASAARAATNDPVLADLARKEQDDRREIGALYRLLGNLVSRPLARQDVEAIAEVRARIEIRRRSLDETVATIEQHFPSYAELTRPAPATVDQVQALLEPGEALIATLVGPDRTFVWAVPERGPVAFAVVPLGREALQDTVTTLRKALEPAATTLAGIPDFDVALAHRVYAGLLEPVRSGWQHARNLIVVADGPLGQLPVALLPTRPIALAPDSPTPFANYREVPWLIRSHAVTMLPSVASLATLRALPPVSRGRRPFVGFGDPHFSTEQARLAVYGPTGSAGPVALATRAMPVRLRGTPRRFNTRHLATLPPLPDTADEILGLARTMNADPARDVFLGARANEQTVKRVDLANYRVVAFATHGLGPGDIDSLTQPALALSAPDVAGVDGDGLLTMDEILSLRLNADWVVLSACNSASGEGAGSESLSGLGRAFFYAGARALLVSHWPLETTSARAATTELLRRLQRTPAMSRAEALQQTMNWLIDQAMITDARSGTPLFSYAHPIFWAAFTLIGDGRGDSTGGE